ncbi:hypothetical protein [Bacillus sp. AK128]
MSENNQKLEVVGDILTQASTSGVLGNTLALALSGAEDLNLLLSIGIPAIGATSAVLSSVGLRENNKVIELEIEKLEKTISKIREKLEKHGKENMVNLFGARLNTDMYQFIKNILNEAINAKTDAIREYCASFIVWVGGCDYENELDYRKLYRSLNIIKELDDLDFDLLNIYVLGLQVYKDSKNMKLYERLIYYKELLLRNESILTQEIKISINKLANLGLFQKSSELYSYENLETKTKMIEQIEVVNPRDITTGVFDDFNKYVFTFF